jgi:urease accessory protein
MVTPAQPLPPAPASFPLTDVTTLLDLLQLADSALPVGSQSHSFGLETLVSDGRLTPATLPNLLEDYLHEVGHVEAIFCRAAQELAATFPPDVAPPPDWLATWGDLNARLSALRPARESRAASLAIGRRLLNLAADVSNAPALAALAAAGRGDGAHAVIAFGAAAGVWGLPAAATPAAYLHQSVLGLLTACQKLMPLGQSQVMRLRWRLKGPIHAALARAQDLHWRDIPPCCTPLLDLAAMRHPGLRVRLFIS